MIAYSNKHLRYGILFYDQQDKVPHCDVLKRYQTKHKGFITSVFYTLQISLTQEIDELFNNMDKNTKYEIKRALLKDDLTVSTLDPKNDATSFYEAYSQFANLKGLKDLNRKEIDLFIERGIFQIRAVALSDGTILVYHTYIVINGRARLMHSISFFNANASHDKNLIGRANRLLHWEDIKLFKESDLSIYDLGGIDLSEDNAETKSINKFKSCFGGILTTEYNVMDPKSVKGFLFLLLKRITRR